MSRHRTLVSSPAISVRDAVRTLTFDDGWECRFNAYGLRCWVRFGREEYSEIPAAFLRQVEQDE